MAKRGRETLYFRYVATTTLSRLIEPLKDEQVLLLESQRNWRDTSQKSIPPVSFITFRSSEDLHLGIKYNGIIDGAFHKKTLLEYIEECGAKDISVDKLDLLIPEELKMGEKYAKLVSDGRYDSYRKDKFIARFKKYPASRDGVENEYTRFLDQWRGDIESELGFRRTSLDFQYALPIKIWREISRGRIPRQRKSQLKEWESLHQNIDTKSIREIVISIFPRNITNARQYTLQAEGRWILTRHGDF